jgi:hypothetical protein
MTSPSTRIAFPEIWTLIGTHLPPCHLFKLLCTSKEVNQAVDTSDYWTRAAAQLIWRDCPCMEIHPNGPSEDDVMPRIARDLYDIPRTNGDYHMLMERFFKRMDEMNSVYLRGSQEMLDQGVDVSLFGNNEFGPAWWRFWFAKSLSERNVHFYVATAPMNNIRLENDESGVSQKELARRKTLSIVSELEVQAVDWVNETLRREP